MEYKDKVFDIFRECVNSDKFMYFNNLKLAECKGTYIMVGDNVTDNTIASIGVWLGAGMGQLDTFEDTFTLNFPLINSSKVINQYNTAKLIVKWLKYFWLEDHSDTLKDYPPNTEWILNEMVSWMKIHKKVLPLNIRKAIADPNLRKSFIGIK